MSRVSSNVTVNPTSTTMEKTTMRTPVTNKVTTTTDSKHYSNEEARELWRRQQSHMGTDRFFARDNLMGLVMEAPSYESVEDFLAIAGFEPWMKAYKDGSEVASAIESVLNIAHEDKLYYLHKKTGISIPLEEYQVYDYVRDALDRELDERIVSFVQNPGTDDELLDTYDKLVMERVSKLNAEKALDCGSFTLVRAKTNPMHTAFDSRDTVNWTDVLDALPTKESRHSTLH